MGEYSLKDLTFVVPAYGRSPYLESCVRSVVKQAVTGNVIVATSTPDEYISGIAAKYGVEVLVRGMSEPAGSGIAADWNFAYSLAKTRLITLAHQDDVYGRHYADEVIAALNKAKDPLIAFTDYAEIRSGRFDLNTALLWVKRLMLSPLKVRALWSSEFVRRRILSFGSPICCPSVCYVKDALPFPLFTEGFRTDLDWQAWERISRMSGSFVYTGRALMAHRIHDASTTSGAIADSGRMREDTEMFGKFWPEGIARVLEAFYRKAEELN